MVGSTWPRVCFTLESDCLPPRVVSGDCLALFRCGLTARYLHCRRAHLMSRDWGCTSTSYRLPYALPFVYAALRAIL